MSNSLIDTIVKQKPKQIKELALLPGIGNAKLYKYGPKIIEIVKHHVSFDDSVNGIEDNISETDRILLENAHKNAILAKRKLASSRRKSNNSKGKTKRKSDINVMSAEEIELLESKKILLTDLNIEQQTAAKLALSGNNMFITGSG